MPSDHNFGALTIAPGNPSVGFWFTFGLFGVGPVFCMFQTDRRVSPEAHPGENKVWITEYGMGEDESGNTIYRALVSNNSSIALSAHPLIVWWPEFQADWNA